MKYINLCPHPVRLRRVSDGGFDIYDRCETPARAYGDIKVVAVEDDYLFKDIDLDNAIVVNVPEQQEGVRYIVSRAIKRDLPDRDDLFVPSPIRDETGRTIGADALMS